MAQQALAMLMFKVSMVCLWRPFKELSAGFSAMSLDGTAGPGNVDVQGVDDVLVEVFQRIVSRIFCHEPRWHSRPWQC